MDFKKLSSFILIAGFVVFLYGAIVMVTNLPLTTPNTGNAISNFGISISNIAGNINREAKREDAKKVLLIGGIILFVGIAVRMSSKSGKSNEIDR
jgi:glucose uptake protein GlcU